MDRSQLEQLYARVVEQAEYPGHVCPTETKMVEFVSGALSEPERRRLKAHLPECAGCRHAVEKLRQARAWFTENASLVFSGLAEKAADAGVKPWAACPAADVLERYVMSAVPATEAGDRFKARIEQHLAQCAACRQAAEEASGRLATMLTLSATELQRRADRTALDALRDMLVAIRAAAAARGLGRRVRAMPGFRSQPASSLDALVVDAHGTMVLDDEGRPERVSFDLVRAEIEGDGHFVLDLSTANQAYWESGARRFTVCATLAHENQRLVLPPERIYGDGRATMVGKLPTGLDIRELPIAAMWLSVVKRLGN